jgi:hypothetical protein
MNKRYVLRIHPGLSRHDAVARAMSPVLAVSAVAICMDGFGTIHQGQTMLELESLIDVSPAEEFANYQLRRLRSSGQQLRHRNSSNDSRTPFFHHISNISIHNNDLPLRRTLILLPCCFVQPYGITPRSFLCDHHETASVVGFEYPMDS